MNVKLLLHGFGRSLGIGLILGLAACQSATGTPAPLTGQVTLRFDPALESQTGHRLDVDTGQAVGDAAGDIELRVSGGSTVFNILKPVNGAQAKFVGTTGPDEPACLASLPEMTDHNIPEVAAGGYLCLLSNESRLARLSIKEVGRTAEGTVEVQLEFTSWPARAAAEP